MVNYELKLKSHLKVFSNNDTPKVEWFQQMIYLFIENH